MRSEGSPRGPGRAAFLELYHYNLNLDRSIGSLLKRLWTNSSALGIIKRASPRSRWHIRSNPLYALTAIAIHCTVAKCARKLGRSGRWVTLPNSGEVAIFCFPAYVRIFDLQRCRITNLFEGSRVDVRRSFGEMLSLQNHLESLRLAPRIYANETSADRYVEEYCPGTPLPEAHWWSRAMFDRVCNAAAAIQSALPLQNRGVEDITDVVSNGIDTLSTESSPARKESPRVRLLSTLDWAAREAGETQLLELTLSHGDLAPRNVIVRPDQEIVLIDWQTVGHRPKNYDIYNYVFSVLADESQHRVSDEWAFRYLNSILKPVCFTAARKALAEYALAYLETRVTFFLLPSKADPLRMSRLVSQVERWLDITERYLGYCQRNGFAE